MPSGRLWEVLGDRRRGRRYPVDLELEYRVLDRLGVRQTGRARVLNLSTSGIYFQPNQHLPAGFEIEIAIPWPSSAISPRRMQLYAFGKTVRSEEDGCAVRIFRCEFRVVTAGRRKSTFAS